MNYEFKYIAPRVQGELLELLSINSKNMKLLAGGTDLISNMRLGIQKPDTVVDLKKIREHAVLDFDDKKGLSIGAAVTVNELLENKNVAQKYPALISTAKELASHQIRNRATVIGNICNASPCADMAPSLLCLNARVVLASKSGTREILLKEFFTGVKKTRIRPDEYCERIIVPAESANAKAGFRKLKRIKGHDLSIVSVCMTKKKGIISVAVGSAAQTPVFAGEFKSSTPLAKMIKAALQAVDPIDDVRGSREYRLFMIEAFMKRLAKDIGR